MMEVCVLASGSKGNSIYVSGGGTSLLVDAGLSARELLARLRRAGIDPGDFERSRAKLYGRSQMRYNSAESTADSLVQCAMFGDGLFDDAAVYRDVTVDVLQRRLQGYFDASRSALSVINPVGA